MQVVPPVVPDRRGSAERVECPFSMYRFYSALLALGVLLTLPYWLLQALRHGKYRAGLGERLGAVPARLGKEARPGIWIHAVSVGEVLAVGNLVAEMRRQFPRHRIMVSTTTDSGQKLARNRFGEENVFYFPMDFAFAIGPYLRWLRPELVVIAETEFWPNFLRLSHAQGARIAVVNARISDRSWPGYRRWRAILKRILQPIDLFLAQTEADRERLLVIGAPADRVRVSGNLKFDVALPTPPPIVAALRLALQQGQAGPVVVCGSTVEGEEELLLGAFRDLQVGHARALMILAPRHPERFEEVAQLLQESGVRYWRRSQWKRQPLAGGVLLLDTIGELASLYALGGWSFVGGSLVPRGGHNMVEPAQHGIPIVIGPHTENFRDVVESFAIRGAVRVVQPAELSPVFMELASHEEQRRALGRGALETVRAQVGATQRTLDALEALLQASAANL
jgi:3-deoxy-D-manno-octulosonic-acid transferase